MTAHNNAHRLGKTNVQANLTPDEAALVRAAMSAVGAQTFRAFVVMAAKKIIEKKAQ